MRSIVLLALAAPTLAGCLPGDTRPEPAAVDVTAEPSAAQADGFDAVDGWHVAFDRVLAGVGHVQLEGGACTSYANARYDRLLDLTGAGRQKVSQVFALGSCDLRFRSAAPGELVLLGAGVTADDLALVRSEGGDAFVPSGPIVSWFVGHASRQGVEVRFSWAFRQVFDIHDCLAPGDAGQALALELGGGATVAAPLVLHGEKLFRDDPEDDAAPLRFQAYASADADGDGAVTLGELAKVYPPDAHELDAGLLDASPVPPASDAGAGGGSGGHRETLAERLYQRLAPGTWRLGDSPWCRADAH